MENQVKSILKKLKHAIILFVFFWVIAILFWQLKGNIFFLFNFGYIGTALAVGLGSYQLLPRKKKPSGRRLAQFLVGIYLLVFLGLIKYENMQIEGFFFYLLGGIFSGSVIHYLVGKVMTPVIIGRGWCGWACWTTMILDYLPYKNNKTGRLSPKWEKLRYIHFLFSFALVFIMWFYFDFRSVPEAKDALVWLIIGNIFYFGSGIIMAFLLKDNRAFCKYLCPITVILKVSSRFALFKMEADKTKCNDCNACTHACPMDINIPEYTKRDLRVLSTECINCQTCSTVCPQEAISWTFKWDPRVKEILRRRPSNQ